MVDKNLRDGEICVGALAASDMAAATENEFNSCDEPKLVVVVCIGWLGLFLDLTFFMAIAAECSCLLFLEKERHWSLIYFVVVIACR